MTCHLGYPLNLSDAPKRFESARPLHEPAISPLVMSASGTGMVQASCGTISEAGWQAIGGRALLLLSVHSLSNVSKFCITRSIGGIGSRWQF